MGLTYRRRHKLNDRAWINLNTGMPSVSVQPHRRVTLNSRGQLTIRLGSGFAWKTRLW